MLLAFSVLRLLSLLPYPLLFRAGRLLGHGMMYINRRRRRIARANIRAVFPELDAQAQAQLVTRHFQSLGIGLFEMALTWWSADKRICKIPVRFVGADHLQQALARGKGVIFLGSHFTTMDIGVRLVIAHLHPPIHMTYRPHNDPMLDRLITANRVKYGLGAADFNDVRSMVRTLKSGELMWYAPDQGYRGKMAEFVPFFSIPVSTHTATSRLARLTGAAVVPYYVKRDTDLRGYTITIYPALENFPSDDVVADISRCHQLLEKHIREAPEQYLWVHRRFKHLPPGAAKVYDN